ncbi:MAG: serine/threonine-protein phosphatase, partial [Okeania sp. SIO2H7]|nr:serine/threonine-protein phosphatase [Okeania sp. SIO2H7]
LIPRLAIICDGVGGHEGGEVASQLGIENLKLLMYRLISEVATQEELMQPELVSKQLEEIIRVVNNAIAAKNDEQKREHRQRMGTTLVMALQLPQQVITSPDSEPKNAHELYVAHVGDSRAYWLSEDSCLRLTVDDDVAAREVMFGRCLYWEALQRPDSGALTQALGTRDGEFIRPTVKRFAIEDNGLLLLCSDGLSDNDWIETYWHHYASPVINGELPLEAAVESLIDLANQKNGHDNTSVVLVNCRVTPPKLVLAQGDRSTDLSPSARATSLSLSKPGRGTVPATNEVAESEMSEASKALLYDKNVSEAEQTEVTKKGNSKRWLIVAGILIFFAMAVGVALWRNRDNLQKTPEDFPYPWETPVSEPSPPEAN